MVQREIADRLRAAPGSRVYGSPSVLAQIACEVELARKVDPAVFKPRPRVDSAILRLRRTGPPPTRRRATWFATPSPTVASPSPARWSTPAPARSAAARAALEELGLPPDARAEALSPEEFMALSAKLETGA